VSLVWKRATTSPRCSSSVGIRIGGLPEPLCMLLRIAAWRSLVTERLRAGRFKASALLTDSPARVRWIEDTELRSIDPDL
jgi:hypothetical protein